MSKEDVTTVAADFMYLIIIGDPSTVKKITNAMNEEAGKKKYNKLYVSADIDTPLDNLPDTELFQTILINDLEDSRRILLSNSDDASDVSEDLQSSELQSSKKYFVMAEGIETAHCHTCGEGYSNAMMLVEIESNPESFTITFPVLNLDDEVNPEDLISSWVLKNNISHVADSLNIRLVNMVGTNHDILVFAAYVR